VLPDIVITDLQMPKMDGRELIAKLKSSTVTAQIPIVVLSGRTTSGEVPEPRADFTIYKDIGIEAQLGKAIAALLGDHVRTD
jgi:CheY-like chemotaxis protein